jgi:hypothetical protein
MPTEDNEDHQFDARNSIHKEAVLSPCSNADTDGGLAHCALDFVSVDTSHMIDA